MGEATCKCPHCGGDIAISEYLNSDLRLIADKLHADNAKLREERDEARTVAGYCLRKAFSSWPGLGTLLRHFEWLIPAELHAEIPREVSDE